MLKKHVYTSPFVTYLTYCLYDGNCYAISIVQANNWTKVFDFPISIANSIANSSSLAKAQQNLLNRCRSHFQSRSTHRMVCRNGSCAEERWSSPKLC